MAVHDILLLSFFVGVFVLFGGVLGFASWEESCARRKAEKAKKTPARQPEPIAGQRVHN